MKRNEIMTIEKVDPLKKRELFAVSLRKQKTKSIIEQKRKKLHKTIKYVE